MAIFERPVKDRLDYDGASPFPGAVEHPPAGRAQMGLTAAIVILPFFALGALTAFLRAGLIRVALLQHVTWSVNSLCHVIGSRPFKTAATTARPTCGRWPCCRSGKAGTTVTTANPAAPVTAWNAADLTRPPP
jgi:hypothetical protein